MFPGQSTLMILGKTLTGVLVCSEPGSWDWRVGLGMTRDTRSMLSQALTADPGIS